jgi:hypothetical protein
MTREKFDKQNTMSIHMTITGNYVGADCGTVK